MSYPLPIRVEPNPGEAWHGYLRRVAAKLRVASPNQLLDRPFGRRTNAKELKIRRSLGIAASPTTYVLLAEHFNLTPSEVQGMFLQRFAALAPWWGQMAIERFDPMRKSTETNVFAPAVRSPKALAHCPQCRSQAASNWEVTWLTTLQVLCVKHGTWLCPATSWAVQKAAACDVEVQSQVLAILSGTGSDLIPWTEPETFIADLLLMATHWEGRTDTMDTLIPAARHLLSRPGTHQIPEAMRDRAQHRVRSNRTSHDLTFAWGDPTKSRVILELALLPKPSEYAVLLRYQHPPVKAPSYVSHEPRHYPELLPIEHFMPELVLLCGDMPINHARAICAAAAWQLGVGPPWGHGQSRTKPMRPLARLQAELERKGRLEKFWDQICLAVAALSTTKVDYLERSAVLTEARGLQVATHVPTLPESDVELWLHLHWACRRLRSGALRIDLLDLHRRHGEALYAAADEVLAKDSDQRQAG